MYDILIFCMSKGEVGMTEATIGARYQVVIPKDERKRLRLKPGAKVEVHAEDDHIVIYPAATKSWRGIGKDLAGNEDTLDYVKRLREEWGERE
jgi:AbrB family looped-hinge helix DNA binding protein